MMLQAVAAAALAVSALFNAPPGFLEFLLCIPWRKLPQLYPRRWVGAPSRASVHNSSMSQPFHKLCMTTHG